MQWDLPKHLNAMILKELRQAEVDDIEPVSGRSGGRIETGHEVTQLPEADLILADMTPRQLLRIAASQLPSHYCRRLKRFRYGAGAFKIDYALSAPIPWAARECSRATTVHLGGSLAEIVESERTFTSDRPFVLLGQPSLFDPTPSWKAYRLGLLPRAQRVRKRLHRISRKPDRSLRSGFPRLHLNSIRFPAREARTVESKSDWRGLFRRHHGFTTASLPSHIVALPHATV